MSDPGDRRTPAVVFVSSHARVGGAERYLELLLSQVEGSWVHDVVILEDGPLAERLRARRLDHAVVPTPSHAPGILRSAWQLRGRFGRDRPDVVHANGIKAALVCVLATRFGGAPVIWVKHDNTWDGPRARLLARGCRFVVGVSSAVTTTFGDGGERVRIVHNGMPPLAPDRERGRRELADALGARSDAPTAALVGRFDPRKGHGELLATAPGLLARLPGLRIAFIGVEDPSQPEYLGALRRRVNEEDLDGAVHFLLDVPDTLALVGGADVVVVPSVPDSEGRGREGLPYVALEAMALGTPVVAYRQGGLPELLGECGVLVEPGDRAGLGDAVLRVLSDEALRARLGACGRERVAERFSLERTVESMKECYRVAAEM